MLTFLLKIRRNLRDRGATRKYLLCAIGEIVLVAIGILIAIQLNNWNEWKKDRVKEEVILQETSKTSEFNSELLSGYIEKIPGSMHQVK